MNPKLLMQQHDRKWLAERVCELEHTIAVLRSLEKSSLLVQQDLEADNEALRENLREYVHGSSQSYSELLESIEAEIDATDRAYIDECANNVWLRGAIQDAINNIGVPHEGYPACISVAYEILQQALEGDDDETD